MKRPGVLGGIAAAAVLLWPVAASGAAPAVEIRLGFGGWTLAPFDSPVEARSEDVIQDQYEALLKAALPDWAVSPVEADIDLKSSGRSAYAEVWIPIGTSRFAAGIRSDLFAFRVPFTAAADETIQIGGITLAELWGTATGTVTLDGFGVSLLGRWQAISTRRFGLAVRTGVAVFPFRGRIRSTGTLRIETILGEDAYTDDLDQSIEDIRGENDDIPVFIVAPVLGLDAAFRFSSRWSLFAGVSVSQGTFYVLGIAVLL